MTEPRVEVDDTLYGMAEVSRGFLHLERRRTQFLIASIVLAIMMNITWLSVGVLRDKSRTGTIDDLAEAHVDLTHQNEELTRQIKVLTDAQSSLSDTVQNAIDQKIILDELKLLLSEVQKSLECVALYVSNQPSKSPDCDATNVRLKNLQRGRTASRPITTTVTTTSRPPPPTTTTSRPSPPPPPTTRPCRGILVLGICIGG